MGDLGISVEVPTLHRDSQSAIMLAKNPVFHVKTKHIDVKYHTPISARQCGKCSKAKPLVRRSIDRFF